MATSPAPRTKRAGGPPAARIAHGPAYELLAELAAFTSGPARASLESGKPWIRETRRLAGPDLIASVAGHTLTTYVTLATFVVDLGDEADVDDLLGHLRAEDPTRLRRRLIGADAAMHRGMVEDAVIERAASGDARARAKLHAVLGVDRSLRRSVDRLLRPSGVELQDELVEIMAAWRDRVFPRWGPDALAAIRRDVAAKVELLTRTSTEELVAAATAGVAFEPGAWIRQIVIVPTVALRPFVVPVDFDATQMFLVSVSDEAFDPEGVVSTRLAKVAAALGDPVRMRALRELAREDGLTASTLAERIGVERTSLHHHLGLLRSAGLLTIHDRGDGSWHYSVRRDRVDELGTQLRSYLDDAV